MNKNPFEENAHALKIKSEALKNAETLLLRDAAAAYADGDDISPYTTQEFYRSFSHCEDLLGEGFSAFCREVSLRVSAESVFPRYEDNEYSPEITGKIAYIRNTYSDRAYTAFANEISRASALYYSSFRDICEEVFYGRCEYAILPIYTSSDGQLSSFRKLIFRYDLKIVLITDVPTDNDSFTRFALLQKGLSLNSNDGSGSVNLLVSLVIPPKAGLPEILSSFTALGAHTVSVNTNSVEYTDTELCFDITLSTSPELLAGLYLFLEGNGIRYDLIGKYRII